MARSLGDVARRMHSRRQLQWREEAAAGYLFLLPTLLFFCVFVVFPTIFSLYLSFFDWNLLSGAHHLVGLENYLALLQSGEFRTIVGNTIIFTVAVVLIDVFGSLAIAMALNQKLRGQALFRGIYYSPLTTSLVAIGIVWLWIFDPTYGIINKILHMVGITGPGWASDVHWAMPTIIFTFTWHEVGYFTVIYLAGLQGVPYEYKEAASIDGANSWQAFWNVTWPLLRPTTIFVTVIGVIRATQICFGQIYVMTAGGPINATNVVVLYLYQQAFQFYRLGYASSVAYVLFFLIFVATLIQFRVQGERMQG